MFQKLVCIWGGILFSFWAIPGFGQDIGNLVRNSVFQEAFSNNNNDWTGIGVSDMQGSARIVENKYCEIIASHEGTMVIANEKEIDQNRDFEISFGLRITQQQAEALKSMVSVSWGCSFESMNQFSLSLMPSSQVYVRNISDQIQNLIPPQTISGFNPAELNLITIEKIGLNYAFFVNHKLIGKTTYQPFYGNGIIITVGSGLTVLLDFISINYLTADMEKQSTAAIQLNGIFSDKDKVETQEADIEISGLISPTDGSSVFLINGDQVKLIDGQFKYRASLLIGNNLIKLESNNSKGNKQIRYLEIIRQEQPEKLIVGQKRLALIIGNSSYKYSPVLRNPVKDAGDMADLFKNMGFEVMHYDNLDYLGFNEALKNFGRNISKYDVTVVFYAGHGLQVDGKNYMIPVDAQLKSESDVAFEAVDVDKIVNIMAETNDDNLNILILDACRNNPFRGWSRGGPEGLAGIHPPSGVIVAFSTSPGSYASDGLGENGLYTEQLMKQIQISQRVEDIFINTRIEVEKKSNGTQSPWELARLRGKYFLK